MTRPTQRRKTKATRVCLCVWKKYVGWTQAQRGGGRERGRKKEWSRKSMEPAKPIMGSVTFWTPESGRDIDRSWLENLVLTLHITVRTHTLIRSLSAIQLNNLVLWYFFFFFHISSIQHTVRAHSFVRLKRHNVSYSYSVFSYVLTFMRISSKVVSTTKQNTTYTHSKKFFEKQWVSERHRLGRIF